MNETTCPSTELPDDAIEFSDDATDTPAPPYVDRPAATNIPIPRVWYFVQRGPDEVYDYRETKR